MDSTLFASEQPTSIYPTVTLEHSSMAKISLFMKRLVDICVSFIGLLILSPFFLIIREFIRRDSPGPVIFKCARMGKGQRPFMMLKFRTMYEIPSSYEGPRITCAEDKRITPFGHWLRDTKINELPQLWNVLIGEMSLVGPRPEDVDIARGWSEEDRQKILSVRPGITSPASIVYRDEEQLLSKNNLMEDYLKNILPDKMRLDRLYIQNWCFASDFDIIFWTLVTIIPIMVKTKVPEGYLFAGPISRVLNRFISWFLLDFIVSITVVTGITFVWRLQDPINWGVVNLARFAFVIAVIFSGLNSVFGLNRIVWQSANLFEAIKLILSCWIVTFFLLILNSLESIFNWFPFPPLPTSLIIIIGLITQIGFMIVRYRWRLITALAASWLNLRRNRMEIGERLLIVGAGDNFQTANWLLRRNELHYVLNIIGVVDDTILANHGMILNGCLVLGRVADLPKIVKYQNISIIVFTTLNVPHDIREYVDNLQTKSMVRLIFLDNLSKIISRQLTVPLKPLVFSLWSETYHEHLAIHDSFTGLPNRTLFQDRLLHSLALSKRNKTHPMVMFVEIDINHPNELITKKQWSNILTKIIDRLQRFRRESDSLAFLDGGIFAFLLENIPDENSIKAVVSRLSLLFSQPVQIESQVFHLKTTISISPETGSSYTEKHGNHREILDYLLSKRKVVKVLHD